MAGKPSTQHLFANVLTRVHAVCAAELGAGTDLSRVVVEPPKDPIPWRYGDQRRDGARQGSDRQNRAILPKRSRARLRTDDLIASVDVAGPGFINLTLKVSVWADTLRAVLREGNSYGQSAIGAAREGQCRIRLGQSDRADACRALPGRGVWRCAGEPAGSSPALMSPANITSTMPAPRSMCSPARPSCATARRSARASAKFPKGFIPATI